jgi:hypothetical protein
MCYIQCFIGEWRFGSAKSRVSEENGGWDVPSLSVSWMSGGSDHLIANLRSSQERWFILSFTGVHAF